MKTSKLTTLILSGVLIGYVGTAFAQKTPPPAPRPWSFDVGLTFITGDYGLAQETHVWVQTTSLQYDEDVWRFQATIPVVSITGPASVIGNVGRPSTSNEKGLGDATMAMTYKLKDARTGQSDFDFTARVKLPTADEKKGLGTGETDFYLEGNYHHTFGTITPFATLGYRFLGTSAAYPLENGFYTTAGVAAPLGDQTTGGLALTWRERIVKNADHATEAMAFVSHQIDARWKIQGFALTGFTDASHTFGIGGLAGYKF